MLTVFVHTYVRMSTVFLQGGCVPSACTVCTYSTYVYCTYVRTYMQSVCARVRSYDVLMHMYMVIRMYVCMYVCMYICMYSMCCMYVRMYVQYVCMYVCRCFKAC